VAVFAVAMEASFGETLDCSDWVSTRPTIDATSLI
jgi:hypothetical protein